MSFKNETEYEVHVIYDGMPRHITASHRHAALVCVLQLEIRAVHMFMIKKKIKKNPNMNLFIAPSYLEGTIYNK